MNNELKQAPAQVELPGPAYSPAMAFYRASRSLLFAKIYRLPGDAGNQVLQAEAAMGRFTKDIHMDFLVESPSMMARQEAAIQEQQDMLANSQQILDDLEAEAAREVEYEADNTDAGKRGGALSSIEKRKAEAAARAASSPSYGQIKAAMAEARGKLAELQRNLSQLRRKRSAQQSALDAARSLLNLAASL